MPKTTLLDFIEGSNVKKEPKSSDKEKKKEKKVENMEKNQICEKLEKISELCNAHAVLQYLLKYPSVGIIRFFEDLKYLKAKGVNLVEVLDCLRDRNVVNVVENMVVNLKDEFWVCR